MASATDVVHIGCSGGSVGVAPVHALLNMTIICDQTSGEALNIGPFLRVLSDLQGIAIPASQKVSDSLLVNLQVAALHSVGCAPFCIL